MAGWLHSLVVSPLKKLWDRLHSSHRRRRGLYILYKDVKSCPCEDVQNGLDTKVEKSRKQLKERKNRAKKIRGVKKTKASDAAKKK